MTAGSEVVAPLVSDAWATPSVVPSRRHMRIKPSGRWPRVDLRELWTARDLLLFFVWRDIKVRYAQTVLGAGWAILQPVIAMVVFTVIFGRFAGIPSDGVPYAVFSLVALVPWTYFATSLSGSSNSLVSSTSLVTKVYFPRLAIPLSPVLAGLVDFSIAFAVLLLVLAGYGIIPSPAAVLLVPVLVLITMMTAAGVGCWLAALNLQYRDVKQITPFLVQIWMYASPIVYPLSLVPHELRMVYALNPIVGVVAGFRAVLLGQETLPWPELLIALLTSGLLLVTGTSFFRKTERVFADIA